MRNAELVVVGCVAAMVSVARAEHFGGWQYTPPKGFAAKATNDQVVFSRISGGTSCSIVLFPARMADDGPATEIVREWHDVVEENFKIARSRRGTSTRTRRGFDVTPTTASVIDADGNAFEAIHYAITPPDMIGSVLLTSSTDASLASCARVGTVFVGTLALDGSVVAPIDPEARVETPVGRWAASTASAADESITTPVEVSTARPPPVASTSEYVFSPDGTYTFHKEMWGGSYQPDELRVIHEVGTYVATGNQLALVPQKAARIIVRHDVAGPVTKLPLEKVTYTWGKLYVATTNEWQLVLTPPKPTQRYSELATGPQLATASCVYSNQLEPAWKQAR